MPSLILPNVGMAAEDAAKLIPGSRILYRRTSRPGTVVRVDPSGSVLADGSGVSVLADLDPTPGRGTDRVWLYPYEIALLQGEGESECARFH